MNESLDLVKYKYEMGAYTLKHMIELVILEEITKEQFHSITRYDYDGIKEKVLLK